MRNPGREGARKPTEKCLLLGLVGLERGRAWLGGIHHQTDSDLAWNVRAERDGRLLVDLLDGSSINVRELHVASATTALTSQTSQSEV
jgi:hypothetical protein